MNRNLDISTLRSFVTIVEAGGMTNAANRLHMTQSAISMQIKRLEEALGMKVFNRANRKVTTSREGEQLLSFARRMLVLNDEAIGRLTGPQFQGTISLAVPGDLVYPHIPKVMSAFARECPRAKLKLTTGLTVDLLNQHKKSKHDIVLTTEMTVPKDGELLATEQLIWVGARGGRAFAESPLPIGFTNGCSFSRAAIDSLENAGIDWVDSIDADEIESAIVSVAADFAITAEMASWKHPSYEPIEADSLPTLPACHVMMYQSGNEQSDAIATLSQLIRNAFNESS
jgi:DNA-binding transcriptional LysR family regulator